MNILMCGAGKGSWEMRGVQLGAALGARVVSDPSDADLAWADLVVLVKMHGAGWAKIVQRAGKPIVWDALDFWHQPGTNHYTQATAHATLREMIGLIQPVLTIGATEVMATAAGGVYLPHHSWQGLTPSPARPTVQTVAYQGGAVYLGRWAGWLQETCQARGWRFVVNPPDLREADILVAFRDGIWDGWMCREWKSGVKVVNAIAAGRPLISQDSAARRELQPAGSIVESLGALSDALDAWTPIEARSSVATLAAQRAKDFTLAAVAERYSRIMETRGLTCA